MEVDMELDRFGNHYPADTKFAPMLHLNQQTTYQDKVTDDTKEQEKVTWKKEWYRFGQNTTFHGFNKMTDTSSHTLRRSLWFILVCSGFGLFLYQLAFSVLMYFSRPVAVNVKINYNDSLTFPAITICNQNTFRLSKAVEYGWYDDITAIYSGVTKTETISSSVKNVSLTELYTKTSHDKKDLIVSCNWDKVECSHDDFERTITDFGICYTFNSGTEKSIRRTWQSGSDHGLHLILNIEQYEYMRGSNIAAGLKILAHEQDIFPLVKDLGQAVPPGSHAFMGIEVVQVINLRPPYGPCDESKKLHHFARYSVPSCDTDCKAMSMELACGCRDFYIPSKIKENDEPTPVCNITSLVACLTPFEDNYRRSKTCTCPVPCERVLYDPMISYASMSNLNKHNLITSDDTTKHLQQKFIRIREMSHRVDRTIYNTDQRMIHEFTDAVDAVEKAFAQVSTSTDTLMNELDTIRNLTEPRIWFHYAKGLDRLKYQIENDFIRGWEVMEERTFSHVTTGFFETASALDGMIKKTLPLNDSMALFRQTLYLMVDRDLQEKKELAVRARDNITRVNESYRDGARILKYEATPKRRYDDLYTPKYILLHSQKSQKRYYNNLMSNLTHYIHDIETLQKIALGVYETGTYNKTYYDKHIASFIVRAKRFNYQKYLMKTRVVDQPLHIINDIISQFNHSRTSLSKALWNLRIDIGELKSLSSKAKNNTLYHISMAARQAQTYLQNSSSSKTDLASVYMCKEFTIAIRAVETAFGTMRSRALAVSDGLERVGHAYEDIWKSILSEVSLKQFYEQIGKDIEEYFSTSNTTAKNELIYVLRHMIRKNRKAFLNMSKEELLLRTNGDFTTINMNNKIAELHNIIANLKERADLKHILRTNDETLTRTSETLTEALKKFLDESKVNSEFFHENFLQLSIFMKELSYQHIEQQIAYDLTKLWSDIGGSLGLFVGASLLTVFELFDFILHTITRQHFERPKKQPSSSSDNGRQSTRL